MTRRRRPRVPSGVAAVGIVLALGACTTVTSPDGPATVTPTASAGAVTGGVHDGTATSLPEVPWEGGPAYWTRFPVARQRGWSDPGFFPIAVYMGKPSQAARLSQLGINTYLGAEHDGDAISTITRQGLSVVAQDEWSTGEVAGDPGVVGYFVSDECDMGIGCPSADEHEALDVQRRLVAGFRSRADGRFLAANYGNGILGTNWSRTVMPQLMAVVDVASNDKYAYTSPVVREQLVTSPHWPPGADPRRASSYGWQVDRMRALQSPAGVRPNWVMVETGRPFLSETGASTIEPAEIEGAVWSALVHEARGIVYFQHNNDPRCGAYSLVECGEAIRGAVARVDAEIARLAPILNTQSLQWRFDAALDTMLKEHDGSLYVFAMLSATAKPGAVHFSLPPQAVGAASVDVVGEGRALPVHDGGFTDSFQNESTHHVYRVVAAR